MPQTKRRKVLDDIPADTPIEAQAEFYDEVDTADLELTRVEVEPLTREPMVSHSIRFGRATVEELRAVADRRGVGVTRLMRQWIEERLAEERDPRGSERVTLTKTDFLAAWRSFAAAATTPSRRG